MRAYNVLAVVLRRVNYGESDKILTLYSEERGRISAIAKGARKPNSRFSGATEALTLTRFQLAAGKSLEVVTQVEVAESFSALRQDLLRLAHGLYFADLIEHAVEDDSPSQALFDLFLAGLRLAQNLPSPGLAARWLEVQLLADLGYAPNLHECAACGVDVSAPETEMSFGLSTALGGVLCPRHIRSVGATDRCDLSAGALELLQQLEALGPTSGDDLASVFAPVHALRQCRTALRSTIRHHLDRDLKSLAFLDSLDPPL